MNDEKKMIQKVQKSDGRNVETHVEEVSVGDHSERITTVFEERLHLDMAKRMIEKVVPIVTARSVEEFDIDGRVQSTLVEQIPEEDLNLKLLPVTVKTSSVVAPAVDNKAALEKLTNELKDLANQVIKQDTKKTEVDNKDVGSGWNFSFNWNTVLNYALWIVLSALVAHIGFMIFFK